VQHPADRPQMHVPGGPLAFGALDRILIFPDIDQVGAQARGSGRAEKDRFLHDRWFHLGGPTRGEPRECSGDGPRLADRQLTGG